MSLAIERLSEDSKRFMEVSSDLHKVIESLHESGASRAPVSLLTSLSALILISEELNQKLRRTVVELIEA